MKWFVSWFPKLTGWQVMRGGVRDSWHESEEEAKKRCDELNKQDT